MKKAIATLMMSLVLGCTVLLVVNTFIADDAEDSFDESEFEIISNEEHQEIKDIMQKLEDAQQQESNSEKKSFLSGLIDMTGDLQNIAAHAISGIAWKPQEPQPFWVKITTNATVKKNKPILLVSLHGTFAGPAEAGLDLKFRNSRAIQKYAQWLADTQGHDVDLLVFQWAAANAEKTRSQSGKSIGR